MGIILWIDFYVIVLELEVYKVVLVEVENLLIWLEKIFFWI